MATNKQIENILGSQTISNDLLGLILGKRLGGGCAREVFECKLDKSLVIKVEVEAGSFQNIKEWDFWEHNQWDKDVKKWLAPCVAISDCGSVLLQKKVIKARDKEFPKKLPTFLSDIKKDNFGLLKGKFVCCDYGFINSKPSKVMRKAEPWY